MFNNLTSRLSKIVNYIKGKNRLSEKNIKKAIKEVRLALLEADVAFPVIKNFIKNIKKKFIGLKISQNFTPYQAIIRIVQKELIFIMGNKNTNLILNKKPPIFILTVGLQGAGKTTSIAKLSKFINSKYKKKSLVASIDFYRPAAIQQLQDLSLKNNIDFFTSDITENIFTNLKKIILKAKIEFYDVVLIDTTGFIHTDTKMLKETKKIVSFLKPTEILYVVDAMIGQDAVNSAKTFNQMLPITGLILTKADGDSRGGAALSIKYVTGKPIKFIGSGEKIEDLEIFYPERIISRILGMGDVLSFIEDIENKIDKEKTKKLVKKGKDFNLNDFNEQLQQMKNIGSISTLMKKLPNMNILNNNILFQKNEKVFSNMQVIISSMTLQERNNPNIIKNSRKKRIANGSGLRVQDVNQLLKQFNNVKNMMKKIKKNGIKKIMYNIKNHIF